MKCMHVNQILFNTQAQSTSQMCTLESESGNPSTITEVPNQFNYEIAHAINWRLLCDAWQLCDTVLTGATKNGATIYLYLLKNMPHHDFWVEREKLLC